MEDGAELVPRFSWSERFQHALVILLFGILLITGMPQKWPYVEASRWVIDQLGGIFVVRWLHRAAGVLFSVVFLAHVVVTVFGVATRRSRPTLFLSAQVFRDAVQHFRLIIHYLSVEPLPPNEIHYSRENLASMRLPVGHTSHTDDGRLP